MRNLFLMAFFALSIIACKQETRYTQSSAEIDKYKALIKSYEGRDWDEMKAGYADTAKIYHNVETAMSPEELVETHKETLGNYSSYEFEDNKGDIEMVVTDDGETWVNFWGVWKGTMSANGKDYVIPVHVTTQWVDGKIVKEYGYWNTVEVQMDMMAMQAEAAAAEAAEMTDEE